MVVDFLTGDTNEYDKNSTVFISYRANFCLQIVYSNNESPALSSFSGHPREIPPPVSSGLRCPDIFSNTDDSWHGECTKATSL